MTHLIAAGISDVGRVRRTNEDAYLIADSVFAVADGMGGHRAGEVASVAALEPLHELDGRVFPNAAEAVEALRHAVVAANQTVSRMARDEPSYRGMGTTLTAALLEGKRLHVAHVGDSRAYLLRDGHFSQLTDDHTLVQHLIDEGQLTREEAANHPQRSVITRAIGVAPEVDVDSMSLELHTGDLLLLCSDGLTGVVGDDAIATELRTNDDPDGALGRLVELAHEAGAPDNVTAILLRYGDPVSDRNGDAGATDTSTPMSGGTSPDTNGQAPGPATVPIRTGPDGGGPDNWAGRLGAYGAFGSRAATEPRRRRTTSPAGRIVTRTVATVLGVAVVVGLLYAGGRFLLAQSYYVGLEDERVVIYQGIDAEVGPISLSRIVERSDLVLDDIPAWYHPTLEAGWTAADVNDARRFVNGIPLRDASDPAPTPGETADPPATPSSPTPGSPSGPGASSAESGPQPTEPALQSSEPASPPAS